MSDTRIVQVQHPPQGEANPPEWPELRYGGNPPTRRAHGGRIVLPWQALALVLGFGLIVLAFGYWRYDAYCATFAPGEFWLPFYIIRWTGPCWWHGGVLTAVLVLMPLAWTGAGLYGYIGRQRAAILADTNEARTLALRPDRYGQDVHVGVHEAASAQLTMLMATGGDVAQSFYMLRAAADRELETNIAPHRRYSGIEQLNEGAHTEVVTDLGAPPPPAPAAPLALPAGPLLLGLRQKAHRSGEHVLVGFSEGDSPVYLRWGVAGLSAIAGGSGSGKTTTMRLMAAWHALNGGALVVLDPHGKKAEGLAATVEPLRSAFLFEPAMDEASILATLRAADRLMRRRIHGEEPAGVPVLLMFDEITSACRNYRSAPEIINLLLNFADEYRGVNAQALIAGHHWRGDILDARLGGALRAGIHTRIVQRIAPSEAKFLLTSKEAQGIDRLATGEGLFFDGVDDALRFTVPFLDDRALSEATYPQHAGWPLSTAFAPTGGAADPLAELRAMADKALRHFDDDREATAVALLAAKGSTVGGRYAYRVKDVARVLGLKDETIARLAARAGRNGSA